MCSYVSMCLCGEKNTIKSQQCFHDRFPFFFQGIIGSRFTSSPIPVVSISDITFFPMKIGMYPGSRFVFNVLDDLMRPVPITFCIVPQRLKVPGPTSRRRRSTQTFLKLLEVHLLFV